MELDLKKIKKIFFIGIGGIGISALAKMAFSRGIEISGVNDDKSPKTLEPLIEMGAKIELLKDYKELPEADMYVYSDAWLYRGPEILQKARETGKPVMNYFEALGQFAKEYKVIAISGTHGKTTTTAMVSEILVEAGLDPTVIVGSFVKKFGSNFRKGESEYLVVEADEYNRHFVSLNPFITIITNIEADHLDYYKDLDDVKSAFQQLISQTENSIIYNGKEENANTIVSTFKGKTFDYSKYLVVVPKLSVPGIHNRMDAAAALSVAVILNVKEDVAKKALAEFAGTWRRLEKRGQTDKGAIVYDDYAHHPTEIMASLEGLREIYPIGVKKITVLFQPHLYSRTKALFDDFAKSFGGADEVLLLPIYFAREDKDESISSEKLADAINQKGDHAQAFSSFELAEEYLKGLSLEENDVFVTMGAGEAYKVVDKVLNIS